MYVSIDKRLLSEVVHMEILIKFQAYQQYVRFTCHYYLFYVHCWKELLKKIYALTMLCLARSLDEVYIFIQAHCIPWSFLYPTNVRILKCLYSFLVLPELLLCIRHAYVISIYFTCMRQYIFQILNQLHFYVHQNCEEILKYFVHGLFVLKWPELNYIQYWKWHPTFTNKEKRT